MTIAGLTGQYPSATYTLPSAGTDLDLNPATFDARIKFSSTFEYWDETGTRRTQTGDADIVAANIKKDVDIFGAIGTSVDASVDASTIDPWNLRYGVTLGAVTGALKVNCRNTINPTIYNADAMPPGNSATNVGSADDWWDTIDDYNNNATTLPTVRPTSWSSGTQCDATNWEDLTNDGAGDTICNAGADQCVLRDKISGLMWSEQQSSASTWSAAVQICYNLNAANFGGYSTGWRLPTQKELAMAYASGIRDIGFKGGVAATASNNPNFIPDVDVMFWTATSNSVDAMAWSMDISSGYVSTYAKTSAFYVICVR